MNSPLSLSHHERLRNHGSIRRLFESGQSGFVYPLRYIVLSSDAPAEHSSDAEVLFSVPKRFQKRANKRNLLRRRVKESYRLQKSDLLENIAPPKSLDIAIVYSTKEVHNYKTIDNAVRKIIKNILENI